MRKGQTCCCLAGMPAMLAKHQPEQRSIETRARNKRGYSSTAASDAEVYVMHNGGQEIEETK